MDTKQLNRLKQLNLLIVDDNKNYLDNISKGLKDFFKTIHTASTYEKAKDSLKYNPHIILLDIELNESSGIELAKYLKTINFKGFIIFVSGFSQKEYLLSAIKLDVVDYIIKPATLPLLLEAFEKVLEKLGDQFFDKFIIDNNLYFLQTTQSLINNDSEISLGAKERKLLILLINNIEKVITKDEIENFIWTNSYMTDSALKNLILQLRKKIGKDKIINIPGAGWKLKLK